MKQKFKLDFSCPNSARLPAGALLEVQGRCLTPSALPSALLAWNIANLIHRGSASWSSVSYSLGTERHSLVAKWRSKSNRFFGQILTFVYQNTKFQSPGPGGPKFCDGLWEILVCTKIRAAPLEISLVRHPTASTLASDGVWRRVPARPLCRRRPAPSVCNLLATAAL